MPRSNTALMVGRGGATSDAILRKSHDLVVGCISAHFDNSLLDRVKPATVAFPLIAERFDATHIVSRLARLGYDGEAIVFSPRLPCRTMVLKELRALAPGMSIHLVEAA
ncbi:MAG: hypothetical protein DI533_03020 [Cereibacter sphaeroides]|uniref:Uncharacterized protein n=1 Tax=Cereibacter sphaeroides TaxID=1063 RepID=A0A2W5S9H0_CERSP|nr:MAG: hypothetical protein DI533_03020 [Cereibacter sphaeroides]